MNRSAINIILILIVAIASAFGGYYFQQQQRAAEPVVKVEEKKQSSESVIGQKLTAFSLEDHQGNIRHSDEWAGKVLTINFWATWCGPCRKEIPDFVALQNDMRADGVQFVGIALQHADEIQDFLQEFNVNYPALVGGGEVISLAEKLGNDIGALPYTVIVDREGKIAFTRRGELSREEAESQIRPLL